MKLGPVDPGHRDDRPKHEVMADRYAAERMVDLSYLVDLMRVSPTHPAGPRKRR